MVILKDIFLAIGRALLALTQYFATHTRAANIDIDLLVIAILLALLTLWILSGCWASSIASSRRHSPLLSFVLGMLVPYAYPVLILFTMDIKGAKERQRRLAEEKAKAEAAEKERLHVAALVGGEGAEGGAGAAVAGVPERVFDAAYFERIARDEQGNPTGPWRVVFGGSEVRVLRILEPLADVVSVEIEARDGARAKFRIPYARITECEPC